MKRELASRTKATKKQRLKQVERWLRACFPSPLPVRVVAVKQLEEKDTTGECEAVKGKLIVRIAMNNPKSVVVDTLLHEWAHVLTAMLISMNDLDSHADEFWLSLGRIYRKFYCENGRKASEGL